MIFPLADVLVGEEEADLPLGIGGELDVVGYRPRQRLHGSRSSSVRDVAVAKPEQFRSESVYDGLFAAL